MSEIIHKSQRGTVEIFEENGEKRIRRTVNTEWPVYEKLKDADFPYIPKIYSVNIADGKTVITEEFISGKNLLAANLDEKRTVRAMVQLCAALDRIHGLGIVHRDIKPSNILLGSDGNIRLIDFEAARFVREDKDKDTRYLGTDGFAPPEQYGFSQTDFRSDIYAAGQTMKTLLGSLSAKSRYAKIIKKCTALDPAARYQTAGELSAALTGRRVRISAATLVAAVLSVTLFAAFIPKNAAPENIPDGTEAETEAAPETENEITRVTADENGQFPIPDGSAPPELIEMIKDYNADVAAGLTYYGEPENLPDYEREDLLFFTEDDNAKILFTSTKAFFKEYRKFYMYCDLDGDGVNEAINAELDSNRRLDIMLMYGVPDETYHGYKCLGSEYFWDIEIDESYFLQITSFEVEYDKKYAAVTVGNGKDINITEIYTAKDGDIAYVGSVWGETVANVHAHSVNVYFSDGRHNSYTLADGELRTNAAYEYNKKERDSPWGY